MTKTATATTLSPLSIVTGAPVLASHGQAVAEVGNYVAGRRPRQHIGLGPTLVGGGTQPPLDLTFPGSGTTSNVIVHRIWITPDTQTVTVGADVYVNAGSTTLRVTVRIGAAAAVNIDATNGENGSEQTTTVAVADIGTGWVNVEVDLTRASGAATGYLRYFSVQDTPITDPTTMPDPANDGAPTSLTNRETASVYGALDSDAFARGQAVHAHLLREAQRNARRLANTGEYLVSAPYRSDGADDLEATGAMTFDAPVRWTKIGEHFALRKRRLRTATIHLRARIDNGASVLLAVQTGGSTRSSVLRSDGQNVLACVGTGSWEWYTKDDLVLGSADHEGLELWVYGIADAAFDTGYYGSPDSNTGVIVTTAEMQDATASWDAQAFAETIGRVAVTFYDGNGAVIAQPRTVRRGQSATVLAFMQEMTADQARRCNHPDAGYRLTMAPAVRIGSYTIRENDDY